MSLSRVALPSELWDPLSTTCTAALRLCVLVCRTWVPASRFHSFEALSLSQKSRAARLNALLASPHGTIAPAVRVLNFPDTLAPMQIRHPDTDQVHLKTLLALVPRVTQLQHVRALALSDLPWPLLDGLKNVEHLTLTRLCAGPCLLDIGAALPRITHLTVEGVTVIPYHGHPHGAFGDAPLAHLHTLTIRGSSIAFFGWLALVAPHKTSPSTTSSPGIWTTSHRTLPCYARHSRCWIPQSLGPRSVGTSIYISINSAIVNNAFLGQTS
ncbi:hypothetical protein B0H10DRAFT_2057098 [Mycena sp. CBHHK59/15]|nr:hypothetical protein B0H10DRAFT_2057098 [Mycena sp. CBHHK59/15]